MNTGYQRAAGWLQTKWYQNKATTALWVNKTFPGMPKGKQFSLLSTISPSRIHCIKINMKCPHLPLPVAIQDSNSSNSKLLSLIQGMVLWGCFTPFYLSLKQEDMADFFCSLLHSKPLCQVPNKKITFFVAFFVVVVVKFKGSGNRPQQWKGWRK